MNKGLVKQVKHSILVASYLLIFPSKYNSFVYFAFEGFPDSMLIKNINAVIPLILNSLFIMFLNMHPMNSGRPHLINKLDKTKNGNREGKILFLKMFKEKLTDFKILSDSVNISKPIKINIIIIVMLVIFFIISPFSK